MTCLRNSGLLDGKRALTVRSSRLLHALYAALLLAAGCVPVTMAQGPTAAKCPVAHKLTLEQAMGFVKQKGEEEEKRTVQLIQACHVSFSLDASSLEKLVNAGMTDAEFNALNPETAAGLSAEQAHTEVQGLQANRDDIQVEKAFQARTAFLKNARYRDLQLFAYQGYNANTQELTATIGGEEYRFRTVSAAAAAQLSVNPKGLTVVRPFDEDKLKRRVVRLESSRIEMEGVSEQAMLHEAVTAQLENMASAMAKGKDTRGQGDYNAANASYADASHAADAAEILNIKNKDAGDRQDLQNKIAAGKQEIAGKLAELAKIGDAEKHCRESGVWCEAPEDASGLMWTLKDNGQDIDAHGADGYCKALHTGNYSDWRLPTELELIVLFDAEVSRDALPTSKATRTMRNGAWETIPKGAVWQYHIKGGIELTATWVWSSTDDDASNGLKREFWDFQNGGGYRQTATAKEMFRALCVRGATQTIRAGGSPGAGAEPILGAQQTARAGPAEPETILPAEPPRTDADRMERQAEALYQKRAFKEAFPIARQSCDDGSQDGCGLEGAMYGLGLGVKRDPPSAHKLVAQSCAAGSSRGCEVVGEAYLMGIGVPMDKFHGADLLRRTCDAGYAVACGVLAMQYLNGEGVPKDASKAMELLERSCSGGFETACQERDVLRAKGVH